MKIMVLSDVADKALWDYLDKRLLEGVELISVMPTYEDGALFVYWQGAPNSESASGRYRFDFESGTSQLVTEG